MPDITPKFTELTPERLAWVKAMTESLAGNENVQALLGLEGEELHTALYGKFVELAAQDEPVSLASFGVGKTPDGQKPYISPENTVVNIEVEDGSIYLRAYDATSFYQWEGTHGTDPVSKKPIDNFYVADGKAYASSKGVETSARQKWIDAMTASLSGNAYVQELLGLEGGELQAALREKFADLVEQGDPISLASFGVGEAPEGQEAYISPENTVVNVEIEEGNVYLRAYRAKEFYDWVYEHGTDPISVKPIDNFYIDGGEAYTSPRGKEISAKDGWINAMTASLAGNAYVRSSFALEGEELNEAIRQKLLAVVEEGDPISASMFGVGDAPEGEEPYISPENTVVNVEVEGGNVFLRAYDASSFYQWEGTHGTDPVTRKPINNFYVADGEAYASAKGQEVARNAELRRQMEEDRERQREEAERQAAAAEARRRANHYKRQIIDRVRNGRGFRGIEVTTEMLGIMVAATTRWDNPSVYRVNLTGANIDNVDFTNIDTTNIDFTGITLTREQVEQIIESARIREKVPSFKGADLSGLDLSNLDFRYANFNNANLEGVNFTGSTFNVHSSFNGAKLKDVVIDAKAIISYQKEYNGLNGYFEAAKHSKLAEAFPLLQSLQFGEILFDDGRSIDKPVGAVEPDLFMGRHEVNGPNNAYLFYRTLKQARDSGANKIWATSIPGIVTDRSVTWVDRTMRRPSSSPGITAF